MTNKYNMELKNITKKFGDNLVLNNINLNFKKGEILALVGENGAGKSTLVKIITGMYRKDSGTIKINQKQVDINNPQDAEKNGISVVPQDVNLVSSFTVLENLILGNNKFGLFEQPGWNEILKEAKEIHKSLNINIKFNSLIKDLSLAEKQMICITRALIRKANIFLFDEPTAAIAIKESKKIFPLLKKLKDQGCSVLYISHRLEEIFETCDRVAVLRNGSIVTNKSVSTITMEELINAMTGGKKTSSSSSFYCINNKDKNPICTLNNINGDYVKNVSFTIHNGEILGITGLAGSGLKELANILYGLKDNNKGYIEINGNKKEFNSPQKAIDAGISYVPENRISSGIVSEMSVLENTTLSSLIEVSNPIKLIKKKKEKQKVNNMISKLNIVASSPSQKIKFLSGGNQQKVVIAKALLTKSIIYVFHQPTNGVDVGAKFEIINQIQEIAKNGNAVIVISTDIREVIDLCSRILVMRSGKIIKEVAPQKTDEEQILLISSGGEQNGES